MSDSARRAGMSLLSLVLISLLAIDRVRADEPAAKPQLSVRQEDRALPLPAEKVILPPCYRTSRYDVWQYYGVDRYGYFRPRVIATPYGAYYLYNGCPFPWVTTHELEIMPWVVD